MPVNRCFTWSSFFDFGTATTLTLASQEREFKGGLISLGFLSSIEQLFLRTAELPKLSEEMVKSFLLDKDLLSFNETEKAILEGTYQGYLGLILKWQDFAKAKLDDPLMIGMGGSKLYFKGHFDQLIEEAELFQKAFG